MNQTASDARSDSGDDDDTTTAIMDLAAPLATDGAVGAGALRALLAGTRFATFAVWLLGAEEGGGDGDDVGDDDGDNVSLLEYITGLADAPGP